MGTSPWRHLPMVTMALVMIGTGQRAYGQG